MNYLKSFLKFLVLLIIWGIMPIFLKVGVVVALLAIVVAKANKIEVK